MGANRPVGPGEPTCELQSKAGRMLQTRNVFASTPDPHSGIFFLHNAKAGGTAIRSVLEAPFAPCERAPAFSNAPIDAARCEARIEDFRGYKFYAGHFGYATFKQLGHGHRLVTNFREPVSRVVSLYNYWRNNVSEQNLAWLAPQDQSVVYEAKRLTFSDFIRSPNPYLRFYLRDAHFRQLYKSSWSMDTGPIYSMLIVQRRIAALSWFNVAEYPELSLRFLYKAFPEFAGSRMPVQNVSERSQVSVDEDDVTYLSSINARDIEIYTFAAQRLLREVHSR